MLTLLPGIPRDGRTLRANGQPALGPPRTLQTGGFWTSGAKGAQNPSFQLLIRFGGFWVSCVQGGPSSPFLFISLIKFDAFGVSGRPIFH